MKPTSTYRERLKHGFTLMEMLIVVALIAILVAIAAPTFSSQIASADKNADATSIDNAHSLAVSHSALLYGGDYSQLKAREWVAYVEKKDVPDSSQVDSSQKLTCDVKPTSIVFKYGGTDSYEASKDDSGTTDDGSLTLTGTDGKTYTVKVTGDYAALQAASAGKSGVSTSSGAVLHDSTGTYIVGWNNWLSGDLTDTTLADLAASGAVLRISTSTVLLCDNAIVTDNGTHWDTQYCPIAKGTLALIGGTLYIAPADKDKWNRPPGGWISVAQ